MVTGWAQALDLLAHDRRAALDSFRMAIESGDQQLAAEPSNTAARGSLSNAEALVGETLSTSDFPEALIHLRRALDLAEALPIASATARRLIDALLRLGLAEAHAGHFDMARSHLERCLQLSLTLWPEAREDLRSFAYIAMSYEATGDLERLSRNAEAACGAYRKGWETWQEWPRVGVSSFYDREHAAKVSATLASCGR